MRALAALSLLAACARPAEPQVPPAPETHKVAFLVHGYISNGEEFAELARLLTEGGDHGAPLHVHRFDFGQFSRVGSDHNLGVERLGTALGEAVSKARRECPVCRSWAEEPVDVTLVGRSFGGLVVREALLQDAEAEWGSWEVDRVVTMASPMYGSTLTRYSTGFLSVIINGGIRTALFGFIQPERGGAFGRVIDAQVRAMRLGSPYQLEAHDRMQQWLDGDYPPPWLVIPALGAPDPVRKGDGVVRWSAANIAPVFPTMGIETLPVVARHGEMFSGPPKPRRVEELDRALVAVRHFIDHGTIRTLPGVAPHIWSHGRLQRASAVDPPVGAVWLPTGPDSSHAVNHRYERVARADLGDVWLRVFAGTPGVDAQALTFSDGLSPLQSSTEWSRSWSDLTLGEPDHTGSSIISVEPVDSRHLFLPDVTPSGTWTLQVSIEGRPPVSPDQMRVRVNGGPLQSGSSVPVLSLQNNVVDVFLIGETPSSDHRVTSLAWQPPERSDAE
jgi:hypothetical protein